MSLKFSKPQDTAEIPFLEGSKLKLKRPTANDEHIWRQQAKEAGITDPSEIVNYIWERFIVGAAGVVDENDKAVKFSDDLRHELFKYIYRDEKAAEAFFVFVRGPLGNLEAGSVAISNGDGTSKSASDASETK